MAHRVSDGSYVTENDARAQFAVAATKRLEELAQTYGAFITYGELSEHVQVDTGIQTKQAMRNWIGPVLGAVDRDSTKRGVPVISALCVHEDETIGEGYADAVKEAYGVRPDDIEAHAAAERLKCYRYFGAKLPESGAVPFYTPRVRVRRSEQVRRAGPTPEYCPVHHLQLSATGQSGYCDD